MSETTATGTALPQAVQELIERLHVLLCEAQRCIEMEQLTPARRKVAYADVLVSELGALEQRRAQAPAPADLVRLVKELQAHANEQGWQDVDDPIAALLDWRAAPPSPGEQS